MGGRNCSPWSVIWRIFTIGLSISTVNDILCDKMLVDTHKCDKTSNVGKLSQMHKKSYNTTQKCHNCKTVIKSKNVKKYMKISCTNVTKLRSIINAYKGVIKA